MSSRLSGNGWGFLLVTLLLTSALLFTFQNSEAAGWLVFAAISTVFLWGWETPGRGKR